MQIKYKNDLLKVNYIDEGSGEVIVFLHGWLANAEIYRSLINILNKNYRVIAPDFPGFGNTDMPSFAYSLEDYTNFVLLFLEKLGIKKVCFIGHSHGGRTIIELASREIKSLEIDKIVLIDSAGLKTPKKLSVKIKIRTFKICKMFLNIPMIKKLYPNSLDKLQKKFGSADYAASSPILRESMVKLVNFDLKSRLSQISSPVLIIWGENDDATPLSHAKIMEKEIKDSGLVIIKNAGHFSFTSDLPLVERVFKSFFRF